MSTGIWPTAFAGVLLGACAASPQKPLPVAALPVAATAAAATAAPTTNASDNPRIAAAAKRAREMGYHVETRHGEQFYCRTTAPLGSRLTQKECLTVDTMEQAARMADENKTSQQQSHMCQGAGCIWN
jgi:hypothetical protein